MKRRLFVAVVSFVLVPTLSVWGQQIESTFGPHGNLVPQRLLPLIHAPEVHAELKLTNDQVVQLERLLVEIDSAWFPARVLPIDEQRAVVHELEQKLLAWLRANASDSQNDRLRQLEFYAQGSRMLLRADVRERIGLHPATQETLADLAKATDDAQQQLARILFGDPEVEARREAVAEATNAERAAQTKLPAEVRRKLSALLGSPFDPTKLKRIYPLAPEIVEVEHWINSPPIKLAALRGQVVLIHFYAFQCHNCHANFDIYKRWHQDLTTRGVAVIGIQTPETSRERDPDAVKSAAAERQLEFPILVDIESANWKAWGNTMWPTVYVIDKKGYIRHWWQGELEWKGAAADKTIEEIVDALLAEPT